MAGVRRAWEQMHPALRAQLTCAGVTVDQLRAVAVLHDVIEDCGIGPDDPALQPFPERVRTALVALTRRHFDPDESYPAFVARAAADPLAVHVKLLDVADNLARGQGAMPDEEYQRLQAKYRGVGEQLGEALRARAAAADGAEPPR
jgi:hypothetical protein